MKNAIVIFFIIVLLAIFFRFYQLGANPAGFFTDEASIGLNAYSILQTGADTYDRPFPVYFEAVGDYRDPVMIYSSVPIIAWLGLNEYSVRFVSAIYGVAAVIMIYFLGCQIGGQKVGLWSAFLLAISPWHVLFSRVGFQLIASIFWLIFGLYFFHKSFKNYHWFALALCGFILTFFSYSSIKLYLAVLPILFLISRPHELLTLLKKWQIWTMTAVGIAVVIILIYPYLLDGTFFKRWQQVERKDFNVQKVAQSYINHFSPVFLFEKGNSEFPDESVQRHSIHGVGELYWFQAPFLILGIALISFRKSLKKNYLFYLSFLIIYPLGSIFTEVVPQATRASAGIIPFQIITAVGITEFFALIRKKSLLVTARVMVVLVVVFSVIHFFFALKNYPLKSADYWGWQYGYRDVISYFKSKEAQYDDLRITHRYNSGSELLNFYSTIINCKKCSVMNNPIEIDQKRKQIFAVRFDDLNEARERYPKLKFHTLERIYLPNGLTEIWIGEFRPFQKL